MMLSKYIIICLENNNKLVVCDLLFCYSRELKYNLEPDGCLFYKDDGNDLVATATDVLLC